MVPRISSEPWKLSLCEQGSWIFGYRSPSIVPFAASELNGSQSNRPNRRLSHSKLMSRSTGYASFRPTSGIRTVMPTTYGRRSMCPSGAQHAATLILCSSMEPCTNSYISMCHEPSRKTYISVLAAFAAAAMRVSADDIFSCSLFRTCCPQLGPSRPRDPVPGSGKPPGLPRLPRNAVEPVAACMRLFRPGFADVWSAFTYGSGGL